MTPAIFDLTGKVALVTGAAQGMGRAMSMALASAGADLLLIDLNEAGAAQTADAITKIASVIKADILDAKDANQHNPGGVSQTIVDRNLQLANLDNRRQGLYNRLHL